MSQLGVPIARGATADVFAWGAGRILKLYRTGFPAALAEREAAQARGAHAAGAPTPAVLDVIAVEERAGVVFERAEGPTMLEALGRRPAAMDALARQLAALHADLHAREAPSLPAQRQRLRADIARARGLTHAMRSAALAALDGLPDGQALCHGDFHPGNVILGPAGPLVIDWYDAARGDPLADVARTILLCANAGLPGGTPPHAARAIGAARAAFHAAYRRHYAGIRPMPEGPLDAWVLPIAAARLANPVPDDERRALVAAIAARIPHP